MEWWSTSKNKVFFHFILYILYIMYRYTLEKYKGKESRYLCPSCADPDKTFTRYVDTETGAHLADHVGICGRIINCGYHYPPKQFFADNPDFSKPVNPPVFRKKK